MPRISRDEAVVLDSDTLELPYWMFRFDEMLDIIYAGRKAKSGRSGRALRSDPRGQDALQFGQRRAPCPKARFAASRPRKAAGSAPTRRSPTAFPTPCRSSTNGWASSIPRYARADLRALKNRLEALSHDPRYRFMFGKLIVEDIMARVLGHIFRLPKGGHPGHDRAARRPAERSRQFRRLGARAHGLRGRRLEPRALSGRAAVRGSAPLHPRRS